MFASPFVRRIGVLVYLLAFFGSLGGQWLVAQSVAWARMSVDYSRRAPAPDAPAGAAIVHRVARGLRETFDGKHPCEMCRHIQRARARAGARSSGPKPPTQEGPRPTPPKFELCALPSDGLAVARALARRNRRRTELLPIPFSRYEAPRVPPPRA